MGGGGGGERCLEFVNCILWLRTEQLGEMMKLITGIRALTRRNVE